jgi:hypothetical protein
MTAADELAHGQEGNQLVSQPDTKKKALLSLCTWTAHFGVALVTSHSACIAISHIIGYIMWHGMMWDKCIYDCIFNQNYGAVHVFLWVWTGTANMLHIQHM